jgi:hypothetical protein
MVSKPLLSNFLKSWVTMCCGSLTGVRSTHGSSRGVGLGLTVCDSQNIVLLVNVDKPYVGQCKQVEIILSL